MSILFPDNLTEKQDKLTLDRMQSLVRSTHKKRVDRINCLQLEVQELLDTIANLLDDEASYQSRMNILPEVAAFTGSIVEGKITPNPLCTLPAFTKENRATALLSLVTEDPFKDLVGSPNFTVKDPQIVLAVNQMMSQLDSVYKYLKLHEHRIRNARLIIQTKLQLIEALQNEVKLQKGKEAASGK